LNNNNNNKAIRVEVDVRIIGADECSANCGNNCNDSPCQGLEVNKNNVNDIVEYRNGIAYIENKGSICLKRSAIERIKTKSLIVSNCDINYIPDELFEGLNFETIDFESCNISRIGSGVFSDCPNLHHVGLRNNSLKHIPSNTFEGSQKLEEFLIDENQITELKRELFSNIPSLTTFYAANNNISDISSDSLQDLSFLRYFDVTHNQLSNIDSQLFIKSPNLQILALSYNNITEIPSNLLQNSPNVEYIFLDYNNIKVIDPFTFYYSSNLKYIALANNPVVNDNSTFTQSLQSKIRQKCADAYSASASCTSVIVS
jgi:Leucine-rich repeat (LRR) protein